MCLQSRVHVKNRYIRFYGPGEPTQEFFLMQDIVTYAREKANNKLTVAIQTNGCFRRSVKEWLLDNINIIWVSFDGTLDIHNANRPFINGKPSAPIIESNIKWLINNSLNRNLMVGARVTITNANSTSQEMIVDYFISLGIKHIWSDPLFPSVDTISVCDDEKKLENFHFNIDKYVDNYVKAYRYAKSKGIFYGSFLTCNFDGHCSQNCPASIPTPRFTTDGYISACDLAIFGKNAYHMDCFIYGKWNQESQAFDIDEKKLIQLRNRSVENIEHCKNCKAKNHCGGYCMGELMNETGSLIGQKPQSCKAIRRLLEEIGISDEPYPYMHP